MVYIAGLQAAYYVLTGVWPLVHMRSFLAVTGPKTDLWLVKTVGALVTVVGVVIALAAANRNFSDEIIVLAIGGAVALAAIDVVYVVRRTISPIYLADAGLEFVLIILWTAAWMSR